MVYQIKYLTRKAYRKPQYPIIGETDKLTEHQRMIG